MISSTRFCVAGGRRLPTSRGEAPRQQGERRVGRPQTSRTRGDWTYFYTEIIRVNLNGWQWCVRGGVRIDCARPTDAALGQELSPTCAVHKKVGELCEVSQLFRRRERTPMERRFYLTRDGCYCFNGRRNTAGKKKKRRRNRFPPAASQLRHPPPQRDVINRSPANTVLILLLSTLNSLLTSL